MGRPSWVLNRMPDCHRVSWAWMHGWTAQLNVALIWKLCGPLMCLGYFFNISSMGVCATSHCQTSDRLVQELNVCTVVSFRVWSIAWEDYFAKPTNPAFRLLENYTVPIFNSCTKWVDSPGIIHDRTPDCHPDSWVWMYGWPRNWK